MRLHNFCDLYLRAQTIFFRSGCFKSHLLCLIYRLRMFFSALELKVPEGREITSRPPRICRKSHSPRRSSFGKCVDITTKLDRKSWKKSTNSKTDFFLSKVYINSPMSQILKSVAPISTGRARNHFWTPSDLPKVQFFPARLHLPNGQWPFGKFGGS